MAIRYGASLTASRLNRRSLLVAGAGGLALVTTRGSLAQDAAKPTVKIGSKDFTEQIVVNQMIALLLENAGYKVDRKLNLGGTAVVHQALVSGQIDAYVEYTGTGLLAILKLPVPAAGASPAPSANGTPAASAGVDAVYETVKKEYKSRFDLVWLDPLGFNDTYALAMRQEQVAELGVKTISDLKDKAGDLKFGGTQEFLTRPDGLPGLTQKYGLKFKEERGMDPGIMYQALDSSQVDVISAFTTDGRIPALGLVTLEDDLGFFPPYFAAPVVRQQLLDQDPKIAGVLNQLAGKIDNETMAGLNLQVDDQKKEPEDVAAAFLKEQGLTA